jgi:hypothetical protein
VWRDPETDGDVLLDGRNRFAACLALGIEPKVSRYGGEDPAGYALAANIARRSLSKSQAAMIVVATCIRAGQKPSGQMGRGAGVSPAVMSKAVTVYKLTQKFRDENSGRPDWVAAVKSGDMSLDQAYQVVRLREARVRAGLGERYADITKLTAAEIAAQEAEGERLRYMKSLRTKITTLAEEITWGMHRWDPPMSLSDVVSTLDSDKAKAKLYEDIDLLRAALDWRSQ